MTSAPNGNGYGRYTFYASVAVVAFSIVGAILWVGGIASQLGQATVEIAGLKVTQSAQAGEIRGIELSIAQMQRDSREIETQFCASDIVRNLMHANDMRTTAMLWQKGFGTPYPTNNPYYPTICNRPAIGQ